MCVFMFVCLPFSHYLGHFFSLSLEHCVALSPPLVASATPVLARSFMLSDVSHSALHSGLPLTPRPIRWPRGILRSCLLPASWPRCVVLGMLCAIAIASVTMFPRIYFCASLPVIPFRRRHLSLRRRARPTGSVLAHGARPRSIAGTSSAN